MGHVNHTVSGNKGSIWVQSSATDLSEKVMRNQLGQFPAVVTCQLIQNFLLSRKTSLTPKNGKGWEYSFLAAI